MVMLHRVVAFAGHTDVAPVRMKINGSIPPFSAQIVDDMLYGRGAADMKVL